MTGKAWDIYRRIAEDDCADGDLYVFTNLVGVGSLEVNCVRRAAQVALDGRPEGGKAE